MFQKILIANRGEIACRVAATARRMAIRTVAVYSDADANAKHVAACDEAVHIGAAPPRDSYLRWERILEAAKATGAQITSSICVAPAINMTRRSKPSAMPADSGKPCANAAMNSSSIG